MNKEKFDTIANRMNRITREIAKNVELSDEMLTTTDELEEYLNQIPGKPVTQNHEGLVETNSQGTEETKTLAPVTEIAAEVVNVQSMIDDFRYMRKMLRETTDNSRRVLESVTEELVHSDGESRAGLVMAYSELNKSQIESIKLFIQSYREVSTILVNLAKVNNSGSPTTVHTTNVLNIEDKSHMSTSDIINRLKGDSK